MTLPRWLAHSRHPSAILLAVQLAGLLLYPFIETTESGRVAFGAFGIAVLLVTTHMVRHTRGLTRTSLAIALPAMVVLALQVVLGLPGLQPVSSLLEALFYFYAAGALITYMMADRQATTDELYCAAATFTLIAWGFTYAFLFLQALQPGCFAAAVNAGEPRTWTELVYLSFALLSSTGIGDVIPLTPHARALAALEMLAGVMYLAAVVSRLIGLTLLGRSERPPRD